VNHELDGLTVTEWDCVLIREGAGSTAAATETLLQESVSGDH
jgi:hypothetical protein